MSTGPVLVTGATGFVGSAVVRSLLRHGYAVRALVRSGSRRENLAGLTLDWAVGDVRDVGALDQAMRGCTGVFHVAADYRLWTPDPAPMYATNVAGSRHVIEAAARADVRRVVYTSSVATLGLHADASPADEDVPVTLDAMVGHYKRSKFLAEQAVREAARSYRGEVVIVHPAAPVGPRDSKPTPTGRLVLDAARGRMPAWVDTGLNLVHVDDVAEGHRLAFERGQALRHYILGAQNLSLRSILETVADLAGRRPPRWHMAHGVALSVAYLAEAWARVARSEPRLTVAGVQLARKHMYFTHARASAELGYAPRPAREGLRDAIAWFDAHGYR